VAGDHDVARTIAIHICGKNRGGGFRAERAALEMGFSIVEADLAGSRAVCHGDIGRAIAVQIGEWGGITAVRMVREMVLSGVGCSKERKVAAATRTVVRMSEARNPIFVMCVRGLSAIAISLLYLQRPAFSRPIIASRVRFQYFEAQSNNSKSRSILYG
jgi:hypothetical protein